MRAAAPPDVFEATSDLAWIIEDDAVDPLRESSREARLAVSNGFLGVRCSRAINREGRLVLPPRTYVAGLFDTSGPQGPISGLVPASDWLQLRISMGNALPEHDGSRRPHRLVLDMKRGVLITESRPRSGSALRFCARTLHFVSLSARSTGVQLIESRIDEGSVELGLEARVNEKQLALVPERLEQSAAVWRTKHSGKRLALATAASLKLDGEELAPAALGSLAWAWHWTARPRQVVFFERMVSLVRGDTPDADVAARAHRELEAAQRLGWRGVLAEHEAAWKSRWECSDVVLEGDDNAQRALRFAVYQLIGAADPTDERVSIGARGLTGEDYHGHVFWDTEIYLVPFYVMTWPEAARALLMYRFHTLAGARAKAKRMGWRGALYAWESADTGDETAPEQVIGPDRHLIRVLSGQQEQHISADVAYAVWHYWQATRDERFFVEAGAEVLLETGRFWASRAALEADGGRHIRNVIGPDEYHENIDDNAFTNVMARWNLERALDTVTLLRERWPERWTDLRERLALDDRELEEWRRAAETIVTGFDAQTGLFEQFEGFFGLEDIDLTDYAGRSVPMDVVLGRERTQHSQVVKQADVVALLGLLPEAFPGDAGAVNFRYYEPRCGHGSSLSRAMHALVAARLGDAETALAYFAQTAAIDLDDSCAAIAGGVHVAAQGGIWMTAVFGFAGVSLRDESLALAPRLPADWRSLTFRLQWRGRSLKIAIDQAKQRLEATLEAGEPMTLVVNGEPNELRRDRQLEVPLPSDALIR